LSSREKYSGDRRYAVGSAVWLWIGGAMALSSCGVTITRLVPPEGDAVDEQDAAGSAAQDGGVLDGPVTTGPDVRHGYEQETNDLSSTDVAPRGLGVVIDGTWVAKKQAIVLIHVGHSNMAGRATNPHELITYFHETHPRLWSYRARDPLTASGPLMFRPAAEPLAEDEATGGRAGPGMALLRSALAIAPESHIISIGSGQSGASYGLCESYKKGGLFYDFVMRPARSLRGKVTFGALFTMFGANEYWGADPSASGLSDCLRQLASDVRAELGEPDLPVLIGDFEMTATGHYLPTLPGPAAVISELRAAVKEVARSALIPTDDIPLEDDHHFNLLGHKIWAERGLHILRDRGWAPWAVE
jgi:hypothetical protein